MQGKYLFRDWNGSRKRLENRGVTFDFYYTDDALGNPYGGRFDFGVWRRIRGTLDVDFSRFTSWQGLTFHATGLWQYGVDLSNQYTFTAVDSSSLPSSHTLRMDSYWLQLYLLHHKLVLRGGQIAAYDSYGDSEFWRALAGPAGGRWSKDTIALVYVRTGVGSHYRESLLASTGKHLSGENLVEANYQARLTPWLIVQPVPQWFVRPDADPARNTVFVAGFRTKITF